MSRPVAVPVIALTLSGLAVILLSLSAMPEWLAPARPYWPGLWVIYWVMRLPHRIGLLSAWMLGLLYDGMSGSLLGPNGLALAVIAYFTVILRSRVLYYAMAQQLAVVALLCGGGMFISHWAQGLGGRASAHLWFLVGGLTSAACWPIVTLRSNWIRHMEGWDVP